MQNMELANKITDVNPNEYPANRHVRCLNTADKNITRALNKYTLMS